MKNYIGIKQVKAQPMAMGEAKERNLLQSSIVVSECEKDKAGYLVEYDNGYQSWSPADVFDKHYKLSETFVDRLNIERDELVEKIKKLESAISKRDFISKVGITQYELLYQQLTHMNKYLEILEKRLNLLNKE